MEAHTPLEQELLNTVPVTLVPKTFFVSWQGVLTLAFTGWPREIIDLKRRLLKVHPDLPTEASGSKWPKVTVACLRNSCELTRENFENIHSLCKDFSREKFRVADGLKIVLDCAAVVVYENRSLERVVSLKMVPFAASDTSSNDILESESDFVDKIVSEADDDDYFETGVRRSGHRESHYTNPHLGVTLVHPLTMSPLTSDGHSPRPSLVKRGIRKIQDRTLLLKAIREFKERIEDQAPGMYYWFDENSLHTTLRTVIG